MYSTQSERKLRGLLWDCPRIACYTDLSVIVWTVTEPLTLFSGIYTRPIRMDKTTICPLAPRILALGEVSFWGNGIVVISLYFSFDTGHIFKTLGFSKCVFIQCL